MGEQGAKSLRGGKMEDVIFAGTANRPPLGRAEVVLTIDNSDGALPIDYSEVTISRLMFRSGQSEYAINGDPCRLLDVQELLSDSGIGREMHVIIGQGQLDTALNAGPEGRRAIIEEAAGVLKHRKRKEKALRKLDAMQANLTRVEDLTSELRRQLKPLGRQAEIARKAAVIQAELRDARLRLLADDLVTLRTKIEEEAADEAAVRERRATTEQGLHEAQAREAELEATAQAEAPRLAQVQDTHFQLSALRERLRSIADLAAERHRNASESVEEDRRGRDPEDMEREAAEIRSQEEVLRERLDDAQESLSEAVAARTAAEQALAAEERRLQAAARAAADRREGLARMRGQVEALRSKVQAAEAEIGRLAEARAEAAERAAVARAEFDSYDAQILEDPELAAEHEAAQEALAVAKEAAEAARSAIAGPEAELKAARGAVAAARTADQKAQKSMAALQARIEALELTLGGAADGGEAVLAAGASGDLSGVLGPVAALVQGRPGAEIAIAAALGATAEAIAVGSLDSAAAALALLRTRGSGRAALIIGGPVATSPRPAPPIPTGLGSDTGTYAIELVTAPETVRPALDELLHGIVVVPDLAAAERLVAAEPGLTAVTRDGDVLGARRAQGGGAAGQGPLQMRATLDQALADLGTARGEAEAAAEVLDQAAAAEMAAQTALDTARAAGNQAQAGVNQAQSALDQVGARLREFDARAAQEAKQAARLEAAVRAAAGEAERLAKAAEAAEESRARDVAAAEELAERLAMAEAEAETFEELDDAGDREELNTAAHERRGAEMEARLTVRTAEERVQAIAGRADALERGAQRERAERARAIARKRRLQQQAKVARAVEHGARHALERIEASLAAAVAEREAATLAQASRESELKIVRTQVRELSALLEKLVNVVHGSEVARAEQRMRLEQLEDKAMEDYGVDAEALVAEYGPDQPVPHPSGEGPSVPYDREVQEKRAKVAEKQMTALGKVNPLALEEFAALEERHAFLNSQLEDLKKTRRDLLTVVKEVDERVQQVFAAAFADTAREFERIFSRLFPGGEGKLILTEPDDMLATGVEVEARPPGKKVKRLSLLSGGERSLVAVAILVAVFRARPSPFYVLDEVEAALDDTNTQRLLSILEELRENSQLIIITHQKRTMEGADALYGVSMRGDGVTQVVSQRLRQPEPA